MEQPPTDKPPVFNSWRDWYAIMLAVLVIQIILFTWLSNAY